MEVTWIYDEMAQSCMHTFDYVVLRVWYYEIKWNDNVKHSQAIVVRGVKCSDPNDRQYTSSASCYAD